MVVEWWFHNLNNGEMLVEWWLNGGLRVVEWWLNGLMMVEWEVHDFMPFARLPILGDPAKCLQQMWESTSLTKLYPSR